MLGSGNRGWWRGAADGGPRDALLRWSNPLPVPILLFGIVEGSALSLLDASVRPPVQVVVLHSATGRWLRSLFRGSAGAEVKLQNSLPESILLLAVREGVPLRLSSRLVRPVRQVGVVEGGTWGRPGAAGGPSLVQGVGVKKSHPEPRQPVTVHVDDPLPLPDWLVGLGRPFGPRVSCVGAALAEAGSAALRIARAHCGGPETLGSREKREKLQEHVRFVIGGLVWGCILTLEVTSTRPLARADPSCGRGAGRLAPDCDSGNPGAVLSSGAGPMSCGLRAVRYTWSELVWPVWGAAVVSKI